MVETQEQPGTIRHYRRLAKKIVEHHFKQPPTRIVYKRSGLSNYVYVVNHVEGQFVVRISPAPEKIEAFRKELWATQKVREVGVPSPEVLAVGNIGSEPYMITRRVTGTEASHHPRRNHIVHEIGRYAQVINSIRTTNFGSNFDWTTNTPQHGTWAEYLDKEWQIEQRLSVFAQHKMLSSQQIQKLRRIIDDTRTMLIEPALNHGDLRLKNVIVDDDGEIAAIVDWEDCLSTIAPQWELSISLHDLSIDEKHLFLEGYDLGLTQVEEMSPLIKAFNIVNYSNVIEHAAETGDHKSLAEFRLRLSGALDLYSLTDAQQESASA
ncbi:MAG TPA: aminoglycoside phosphotransferase family protein [Pyrinomonadaceae bacterium]|nr:aminoglycoside phosphotransferase family protein [Pyrinomonadaceae bacterium]